MDRGRFDFIKRFLKYKVTELAPNGVSRALSSAAFGRELGRIGLGDLPVRWVHHHTAHAAAAAFASGFDPALVVTLDGVGDGASGSFSIFRGGMLEGLASIPGTSSLGIFFEQATTLLNLRELEDEGKVMALANYAYPVDDRANPMLDFFAVDGLRLKPKFGSWEMFRELDRLLWRAPSEQFAYMAQRTIEIKVLELVRNALRQTRLNRIALAGGVASNIKVNRLIKNLPEVNDVFIFPHMGDGGLALGAALWANHELYGVSSCEIPDVYWGPAYSDAEIEEALRREQIRYHRSESVEREAAQCLVAGQIVLWFQGRMEFGPRALGHRSILALPGSDETKERLNMVLKKRVWYQPFCPCLLEEEAERLFTDWKGTPNPFMTMGYLVKPEHRPALKGVIHVDGSCRPQIVRDQDDPRLRRLLKEIKRLTGLGVLLNTSFNMHGEPMVCSPQDAARTFLSTGADCLAIGDFLALP